MRSLLAWFAVVGLCVTLTEPSARAFTGTEVKLSYDHFARLNVSNSNYVFQVLGGQRVDVHGNFKHGRALMDLSFGLGAVQASLLAGMMMSGDFEISHRNEVLGFDVAGDFPLSSAFLYGFGMRWDMVDFFPIKIRPGFRYLRSKLNGTGGTTSHTGCTYDFASGAGAGAGCRTLGGVNMGTGVVYSIANELLFEEFSGGLDLSTELIGVTLFVGADITLSSLKFNSASTAPAQASDSESYAFSRGKSESVYAGLSFNLMPFVNLSAKYTALGQQSISGAISAGF